MAAVVLKNVVKRYGETQVIHGVDLDIEDGEFNVCWSLRLWKIHSVADGGRAGGNH